MSELASESQSPGEFLVGGLATKVYTRRNGAVAHLVLNRADKLNALDPESVDLLAESVAAIAADTAIRAVVVRGEGRAFSAGADLEAMTPLLTDPVRFTAFLDRWHAAYDALAACPVPTIAAVHGHALAGGFELTHVCDHVVLNRDAVFGDQHATFGMFPAGGGIQRLARLVGPRRASWLLMSGTRITAADALAWGLATEVRDRDDVVPRAVELAEVLAAKSANLNAQIKRGLVEDLDRPLPEAFARERPHAVAHMTSDDAARGLAAFRDRAVPVFGPRAPIAPWYPSDRGM